MSTWLEERRATAAEQSQTDPHRTVATLAAAVRKAVEDAKAAKPAAAKAAKPAAVKAAKPAAKAAKIGKGFTGEGFKQRRRDNARAGGALASHCEDEGRMIRFSIGPDWLGAPLPQGLGGDRDCIRLPGPASGARARVMRRAVAYETRG